MLWTTSEVVEVSSEMAFFEHIAAVASEGARKALWEAGLREFHVVCNVVWSDPSDNEYAVGSAVPVDSERFPMLPESLRKSAEEADG